MHDLSDDIREVRDIVDRYKKPVVFQAYAYGTDDVEYIPIRNSYHLFWNDYRALIKHAKSVVDSSNSVPYGTNKPVLYWQGQYKATISTSNGNVSGLSYTQDSSGVAPTGAIPWADGQTYPARLWEDGHEGDWGYNATRNYHNKWEREFIANFLTATGTPLTGRTVPASTTWSGEIYLIGDVVIPNGVTVTIRSGTVINFRPSIDIYEAGSDTTISELLFNRAVLYPLLPQQATRLCFNRHSGLIAIISTIWIG